MGRIVSIDYNAVDEALKQGLSIRKTCELLSREGVHISKSMLHNYINDKSPKNPRRDLNDKDSLKDVIECLTREVSKCSDSIARLANVVDKVTQKLDTTKGTQWTVRFPKDTVFEICRTK